MISITAALATAPQPNCIILHFCRQGADMAARGEAERQHDRFHHEMHLALHHRDFHPPRQHELAAAG